MNFILKKNFISYVGCMTQFYLFGFCVILECYILTSMAYDRQLSCTLIERPGTGVLEGQAGLLIPRE